jgi:hypothetical protein
VVVRTRTLALTWSVAAAVAACGGESDGPHNTVPGSAGTGQTTGGVGGEGGAPTTTSGGIGGAVPPCDEWAGPFGVRQGEVLDPTRSWPGFGPGAVEEGVVALADYAACGDGQSVTALVVEIDAAWCTPCRDLAQDLAERNEERYLPAGVRVISLLVQDEEGQPADVEDASRWRQDFELQDLAVGYDPAYSLEIPDDNNFPQTLVVDPRSMRIVARVVGNVGLQPIIDRVVEGNTE